MSKVLKFPVTDHIRAHLGFSNVPFGEHVSVLEDAYKKWEGMVRDQYRQLCQAEQHALTVLFCLTHPDHKQKHFEVNHPVASRKQKLVGVLNREDVATIGKWVFALAVLVLLAAISAHAQKGTSRIDVIKVQNGGSTVKSFAAPFTLNCSTNMTCGISGSTLNLSSSGGGAPTGYQTLQNATVSIAQETTLNWTAGIVCVDNAGATRSDCALANITAVSHKFFNSVVSGALVLAQPDYGDLTGTPQLAQTLANASHKWLNSYTASTGLFTQTQPACGDLSDSGTLCTSSAALPANTTATAHNFFTAYNSTTGAFTKAQPACADLSDAGVFCNGTAYSSLTGVPATFAPTAHNLLSAAHGDTTAASAVRGDGIFAIGASPTWQRLAHSSATGGYFKWNGTDIVASTLAASGTGSPTACTNQAVTGFTLNADAAPTSTCTTITSAFTSGNFPASAHNLLSATHGDTATHTVARGDLIAGIGASPSWTAVAAGGTNTYPKWNASADVIASTLAAGGVGSCAASNWVHAINADAAPTCTQPAYSDISGTPTLFYQTVQNAAGTGVTQEPKIQFTGTAVTSVVDDGANTRTVVTLTAGSGSGTPCTVTANSVQYNNGGAFGCITNMTSDGTNVTKLTAGAGPFDMTAATLTALRVAGGLTTSTNGDFGYDSTAKVWHAWQNGADRLQIVSTNVGNAGQAFLSNADGSGAFADPIVSGNDAVGGAPTKNPVQVSGVDGSGNIQRILTNTAGAVQDQQVGSASVFSGQLAVSATATALPTNSARNVCVKAATTNGFSVYLGSASVTPSTGMELAPGDNLCMPVSNANLVSLVAVSTGASISFVGTN